MKVLQINSVCGLGSTGRIVTDIDFMLKEKKICSYIAYGRDTSVKNDHIIRIGNKFDYYMHGILTRLFDTHALFGSISATKQFIKQIVKIDPDVIHLHNIHGYYLNIKILFDYLRESKKPVVWTLHDCWSFTGHCAYFDFIDCEKWTSGCHDCPQKENYPKSIWCDHSKQNYKKKKELFQSLNNMIIVTPSQWLAKLAEQSYLSKYEVKVIHNGINLNVFKPIESDFRQRYGLQDKFIILGVANGWDARKGFKYFLELADKLDDNYKIVLVGLTQKQKENLPKNIVGITKTSNAGELAAIYSTANVFINPTLEDNFPTTNLESLACGTPVITFETGGSVECVNYSCGIVVEKGNINELLEGIKQVKDSNLSNQCCLERSKLFSLNNMLDKYEELYINLIHHENKSC